MVPDAIPVSHIGMMRGGTAVSIRIRPLSVSSVTTGCSKGKKSDLHSPFEPRQASDPVCPRIVGWLVDFSLSKKMHLRSVNAGTEEVRLPGTHPMPFIKSFDGNIYGRLEDSFSAKCLQHLTLTKESGEQTSWPKLTFSRLHSDYLRTTYGLVNIISDAPSDHRVVLEFK